MLSSRRRALYALTGVLLAACASTPPVRPLAASVSQADEPFEIAGRLSARRGNEAAAANFRWIHGTDHDELTLATPLGSTLARLDGTAGQVRLELPDGRVAVAPDWEALTSKVLGAPIPLRGLSWWLRGVPHPGSQHTIERDASARASVLWQDGWEIVYGYGEAGDRPVRLRLVYPDTELRLVLDAWSDAR
jgi:outer membrane lipoprotein LolB